MQNTLIDDQPMWNSYVNIALLYEKNMQILKDDFF